MTNEGFLARHATGQRGMRGSALLDVAQDYALAYLQSEGRFGMGVVFKVGTSLRKFRAGRIAPRHACGGLGSANICRVRQDDVVREPAGQSSMAKYAIEHPVRLGLFSALLFGAWAMVITRAWGTTLIIAVGGFVLQWTLWRPGDAGRRREERLFRTDEPGSERP